MTNRYLRRTVRGNLSVRIVTAIILTFCFAFGEAVGEEKVLKDYGGDWLRMKPQTPRGYVCCRADGPIAVDGKADEPSWRGAPWTRFFRDIEGDRKPKPRFKTRAKMLWDDTYFYVHAELEEPHVWATLTRKNSTIYNDNDFEVFIDPDGDNHNYYEFEMNALNTVWELTLAKPYQDGGRYRGPKNIAGLKSGVHVRGTLNDPSDIDKGWSIEIAFPWKGLAAYAGDVPSPPRDGDYWRLGFSRVNWLIDIVNGKYKKRGGHREDNWTWSAQGVINMHRPERWGYVQFSTGKPGKVDFQPDPTLPARDLLMEIYHRQKAFRRRFGRYAATVKALGMSSETPKALAAPLRITITKSGYTATAKLHLPDGTLKTLCTRQDSKIWAP